MNQNKKAHWDYKGSFLTLTSSNIPSSIAKKIWLERSGHDFELLQSTQNLKTRPYSKQQVAKNNFTTEPIFFAIPD
ncbi:hypothetical protein [Companilactobacillus pabuli]|uniref:Uncharacterized protein n=1 Tax=Companilactobacillus pabuli TaxID=2714036 RepID=A0A7L7L1C8_9LACO|nr:hypothetical protein [Companilactobacillus pabuli]MDG5112127.1 hypothetical protein [Companilactobacillus pabuli]QMT85238.1 hypothetical protein G6534_11645 [Companilactobacillus pabuli]